MCTVTGARSYLAGLEYWRFQVFEDGLLSLCNDTKDETWAMHYQ